MKRRMLFVLACIVVGFVAFSFQGIKKGMKEGYDKATNASVQEEQKKESKKSTKIGVMKFADVIREYTNESYVVLSDYEENEVDGDIYICSNVKTKSPVDGENITGTAECRYENDELKYLRVLDVEYEIDGEEN